MRVDEHFPLMSRSRRGCRRLALALAACAIVTSVSAHAQEAPNLAPPAGAGVIVIIPDSLQTVPRSLSELLRGYVPAASVQRSTGAIGSSPFVSLRDASAVRGDDPLVIIDGIRQVSYRVSLDTLDRRAPSILDDVMLEDVARVEVLPGLAAAARYGSDGQRGAIVITTRAPGAGRPLLRASITTSAEDQNSDYVRNLSGVTATGTRCPYYAEASGYCTAVATSRFTPLLDRSPFRPGQQVRAHAAATGSLGPLGYAAALGGERGTGTMTPDAADRTVASLRLQLPVGTLVRVGLASFASERGVSFSSPANYSILGWGVGGGPIDCSPATPCGIDSSSGGYGFPLAYLEQRQPRRRIGHLGSAMTVDVVPMSILSLRTSITADLLRDEESLRDSSPPGYPARIGIITADERNWRVGGGEEARLTLGFRGVAATTTLAARFEAERGHSESARRSFYDPGGGFPAGWYTGASSGSALFRDRIETSLDQRIAWGERAALGIGATRTATGFKGGPDLAALLDPHADAMYQVIPAGVPSGILGSLRVRAAWAQASGHDERIFSDPRYFANIQLEPMPIGGGPPPPPKDHPDRSTELEGGFDAAFNAASSRLSITAFRRHETIRKVLPIVLAMRDIDAPLERTISGGEVVAEATPIDVPAARLHLRGQLAISRDRVHPPGFSQLGHPVAAAVALAIYDGESWAALRTQGITWNDANGNGRIEGGEIAPNGTLTIAGRSRPSRIASLTGDLDLARSFTISALVDHVGGFDIFDATAAAQCRRGACPALNDPNASLADQARAVAVSSGWGAAGFVVPGDATRLRELSLAWHSSRVATMLHATTLRVTLSAYDLASWTRSRGVHPETDAAPPGMPDNLTGIVQPVPRTFALRVAVGY